jgi:hypothetical protein
VSKALDSGQLSLAHAQGKIAISAGQARVSNVTATSQNAKLSLAGTLDLTDGSLEARLLLSGASAIAETRPDIFLALKGPLDAPTRNIDVSALTGWLTLRSVENQAKQLRAIESAPVAPPSHPPESKPAPPRVDFKPPPRRAAPPATAAGAQN